MSRRYEKLSTFPVMLETWVPMPENWPGGRFEEALIRVHRIRRRSVLQKLKPDSSVPPVVAKADEALESGDVSDLANRISNHVKQTVEKRFQHAWEKTECRRITREGKGLCKSLYILRSLCGGNPCHDYEGHAHSEHHH